MTAMLDGKLTPLQFPSAWRATASCSYHLLAALKRDFAAVRHIKPPASRQDCAKLYLLATGFRGSSFIVCAKEPSLATAT